MKAKAYEAFLPGNRWPEIEPDRLRLVSGPCAGDFANKYTLQMTALSAGLPVPDIYNDLDDARRRGGLVDHDPRSYEESQFSSSNPLCVAQRGYFTGEGGWLDGWFVDALPTRFVRDPKDQDKFQKDIHAVVSDPATVRFVQTNFGIRHLPEADGFLQLNLEEQSYVSTLSHGSNLYVTFQTHQGEKGVNWMWFDNSSGEIIDCHQFAWSLADLIQEEFLPVADQASRVLDEAMGGRFGWKHDLLGTYDGTSIIQSRIFTVMQSEDDLAYQQEVIDRMRAEGVPVLDAEIGELAVKNACFIRENPDSPYIVQLSNTTHLSMRSVASRGLDLSHMVGTIFSAGLAGGLLQHGGYQPMAIGAYNGLPMGFF